jgi:hypothetical protein
MKILEAPAFGTPPDFLYRVARRSAMRRCALVPRFRQALLERRHALRVVGDPPPLIGQLLVAHPLDYVRGQETLAMSESNITALSQTPAL